MFVHRKVAVRAVRGDALFRRGTAHRFRDGQGLRGGVSERRRPCESACRRLLSRRGGEAVFSQDKLHPHEDPGARCGKPRRRLRGEREEQRRRDRYR